MNHRQKANPTGGNLRGSETTKDGQAPSETQHSSFVDMDELYLQLHASIASARRLVEHMATHSDWTPAGVVEAADMIDHASDLIEAIIAKGREQ